MAMLGIDAGNDTVKSCGPDGCDRFSSLIGEYRDLKLKNKLGRDDMIVKYDGKTYFAGPIVADECEFGGSTKGDTKAHPDAKLRILIAAWRLTKTDKEDHRIIIGQPISRHTEDEKEKIINMLLGRHEIDINGVTKIIHIRNAKVAAEGVSASMADPCQGVIRYLDIGSGTVNYGTTRDMRMIDRDSFSERFGMNTVVNRDPASFSRAVINRALEKWREDDTVRVLGGGADQYLDYIKTVFKNTSVLRPKYQRSDGAVQTLHPVFGNAVAYYEIAKKTFR